MFDKRIKKCIEIYNHEKFRINLYLKERRVLRDIVRLYIAYLVENMSVVKYLIEKSKDDKQKNYFCISYKQLDSYLQIMIKILHKLAFYPSLTKIKEIVADIEKINSEYYAYNRLSQRDYMYSSRDNINLFLYRSRPYTRQILQSIETNNTVDYLK